MADSMARRPRRGLAPSTGCAPLRRAPSFTNTRFVHNGTIITAAGISAGIDGSLHLVSRLLGSDAAADVARYMEYDNWKPNSGLIVARPAALP